MDWSSVFTAGTLSVAQLLQQILHWLFKEAADMMFGDMIERMGGAA